MAGESTIKDLGDMSTHWSDVIAAHSPEAPEAIRAAQSRLLARYQRPIRRYVYSAIRDDQAVDDLYQNFAIRFVKGDFRKVDPGKGRFRDYLKTALFNLVRDYYKERKRFPGPLPEDCPEPGFDDPPSAADDAQFLYYWREGLLKRAFDALREEQSLSRRPVHALLEYFVNNPKARAADAALYFGTRSGKTISEDQIRKWRMLARQKLRELVVREVERSLDHPSLEAVEEELAELGLVEYLRETLHRRRTL